MYEDEILIFREEHPSAMKDAPLFLSNAIEYQKTDTHRYSLGNDSNSSNLAAAYAKQTFTFFDYNQ